MTGNAATADSRIRILFAEDNPDIARIVAFHLKNMRNVEVIACKDGGEAMTAMSARPVDLAVLDGSMPVADGLTVLRWMRTQPLLASVPVIFLTANHTQSFSDECVAAGARLVMTKPFNASTLVQQIRSLVTPGNNK